MKFIFCGVSKAFDKVLHQGLLYKLTRVARRQQNAPNGCLSVMASKNLDHTSISTEEYCSAKEL